MSQKRSYPMVFLPGIQRDGTGFSGRSWTDGIWTRFKRKMPAKMLGYTSISEFTTIPRGTIVIPRNNFYEQYVGLFDSLLYYQFDAQRNLISNQVNVTPNGFVANNNTQWNFETFFYKGLQERVLIAHPSNNLSSIDNALPMPVYYLEFGKNVAATPINQTTSGGVITSGDYLFLFGSDGEVKRSAALDFTDFEDTDNGAGINYITDQKIVAARRTRSTRYNPGPSVLFWSLDSLIKATYVPGDPQWFRYDTVSDETSILCSNGVIQDGSVYYWIGTDRFYYFDGQVCDELPNFTNLDFFFDNLNYAQRQKVWVTKDPRFGEIWFHFPRTGSNECNHAVIYNKRENCWYDTPISRSCGQYEQTFTRPIWLDNQLNSGNNYSAWVHNFNYDRNYNGALQPIQAHCESGNVAWCALGPDAQWKGIDRQVKLNRIEPDLIQRGQMQLEIRGRSFARAQSDVAINYNINPDTDFITTNAQRREVTLKFISNTLGGYYEFGNTLLEVDIGDVRP